MPHHVKIMLSMIAFLTALYGFKGFLTAETYANFHEAMFGDFIAYWEKWGDQIWRWIRDGITSERFRPYLIIAGVLLGVVVLLRIITISRNLSAAIAGVFLFYLGLWYVGGGEQPSQRFTLIGCGALVWMILSSFIRTEEGGIGRMMRRAWRRIKS